MLQHFSQIHPLLAVGVVGSWIGAYLSMSLLHVPQRATPAPVAPPAE